VFFAFPFEAIANNAAPNNRASVMQRVVDWLLEPQDFQPPTVSVVAPDGGEQWNVDSEHEITWVASDNQAVDSLSVYYSTDGGATFPYALGTGEQNDSTLTWIVPNTPSDSCVVKIVAYDSSLNSAEDVSNAFFSIKSLIGTEPTPGVAWFGLMQNHPNPFNPFTRIEFSMDERVDVSLRVYDVSGRVVKTLVQEVVPVGTHAVTWNGEDESGRAVASGIYVCRLETRAKTDMRKMVLLR
jgi:hypothetical protein